VPAMLTTILGLLLGLAAELPLPAPDEVVLEAGRKLEGRVVYEDEQRIILRVGTRDREIEKQKVASVRAALRELPGALAAISALEQQALDQHLALARELESKNLPLEARLLYWYVLTVEPAHEAANLALGHKQRGADWVIPFKGRWSTLARLDEVRQDWGSAWEFESTHYALRTNLPLRQALDALVDLERFYLGFYGAFAKELELRDVTEPMGVWIHADKASYPESSNAPAYYLSTDARLYVNASEGLRRDYLVHEATHELLDFTAVRARPGKGKIPGWLNEGLAVYMATAVRGLPGRLTLELGLPSSVDFAAFAQAEKPYRLGRVLNFQSDDFHGTSKQHQKYASSYVLVHFLLHAAPEYRVGFFRFLRGAYEGQQSQTHFKKALDMPEKAIEQGWLEWGASAGK
jgi:hypothetical protein